MRKRSTLALASVVVSMLALGAPADAAPDAGWGMGCGLAAVSTDGQSWQGLMQGGPWVVEAGVTVSMRCDLQRFIDGEWRTIAIATSSQAPGVAVVPPTLVGFTTPIDHVLHALDDMPTNLQMCTQVSVYRDPTQPPDAYLVDADDDPSNGAQCAREERQSNELVYVTAFPPRPHGGERCVWADDLGIEPIPDENCLPLPV